MLGMLGQPTVRQQSLQGSRVARSDGRNPTQHIGQVRPHVNAVPPGTLHQRVERRSRLAAMLASEKQVIPADGDGPQKPLNNIVVYWNPTVTRVSDEGIPPVQHVVDRFSQPTLPELPLMIASNENANPAIRHSIRPFSMSLAVK